MRTATRPVTALFLLLAGCIDTPNPQTTADKAPVTGRLDDLSTDGVAILQQCPNVAEVTRYGPEGKPTHRIIHLADFHFVAREEYAADMRTVGTDEITDEQVDRLHSNHIIAAMDIQLQQIPILERLIQHHGLTRIHVEDLTPEDQPIYNARIERLRQTGDALDDITARVAALVGADKQDEETQRLVENVEIGEDKHTLNLLQVGAAGRLLIEGKIEAVLPPEDAEAFAAADPVQPDGTVVIDEAKNEAREDAQVRLLLEGGPFAFIILGGGHDLIDNVERLSDGKAEYIRVECEAWQAVE